MFWLLFLNKVFTFIEEKNRKFYVFYATFFQVKVFSNLEYFSSIRK